MTVEAFDARKQEILAFAVDKSPKGSIDEPVRPLLDVVNKCKDLVTTSSCSGRVAIYVDADPSTLEKVKKGGIWLSVSHDPLLIEDSTRLWSSLFPTHPEPTSIEFCPATPSLSDPIIYFKFEPFILHVLTRSSEAAAELLTVALQAGYANSGIQRSIVQIRGTLKLDVPIGTYRRGQVELCVGREYVEFLCRLANDKFIENFAKMGKFQEMVVKELVDRPVVTEEFVETREQRMERKKRQGLLKASKMKEEREKLKREQRVEDEIDSTEVLGDNAVII
ncbi:hypothetical protein SpCBS45565_g05250 [Spizellomyces sp. 'palustris']|nr:hypothetical protein SpCBS45565_g05250 [Spizellomyces sp. 'palustris']